MDDFFTFDVLTSLKQSALKEAAAHIACREILSEFYFPAIVLNGKYIEQAMHCQLEFEACHELIDLIIYHSKSLQLMKAKPPVDKDEAEEAFDYISDLYPDNYEPNQKALSFISAHKNEIIILAMKVLDDYLHFERQQKLTEH